MGQCCTTDEQKRRQTLIDKHLKDGAKSEKKSLRVLLLGAGGSGKSTLFKQIQRIGAESYQFTPVDRTEGLNVIRSNLIRAMIQLLYESVNLSAMNPKQFGHCLLQVDNPEQIELPIEWQYLKDNRINNNNIINSNNNIRNEMESKHDFSREISNMNGTDINRIEFSSFEDFCVQIQSAVELMIEFRDNSSESGDSWTDSANLSIDPTLCNDLANAIALLWKLPAIQNTFDCRHLQFSFPDNLDFFFNKVQLIMGANYQPTDLDLLKVRIRTTGIIQHDHFISNDTNREPRILTIIDVGGQRSERKKWIKCFHSVKAVIFVAALNHFASLLFENKDTISMHESLSIYQRTLEGKWFKKTPMIIFLNKEDLFDQILHKGHSLSICFDGKHGDWNGAKDAEGIYKGPNFDPNYDYMNDPNDLLGKLNKMMSEEFNDNYIVNDSNYYLNRIYLKERWFDYCKTGSIVFICRQFHRLSSQYDRILDRDLYIHVTCATQHDQVLNVFTNVVHSVILNNLVNSGLLPSDMGMGALAGAGGGVGAGVGATNNSKHSNNNNNNNNNSSNNTINNSLNNGGAGTSLATPNNIHFYSANPAPGPKTLIDHIKLQTNGNEESVTTGKEESQTVTSDKPMVFSETMGTNDVDSANVGSQALITTNTN